MAAELCHQCDGEGFAPMVNGHGGGNCPRCGGGGKERPCVECGGSGAGNSVDEPFRPCLRCGGHGRDVPQSERGAISRYRSGGYGSMVESDYGKWFRCEDVESRIEALIAWCDERRNAPYVTTLGMVQDKLRSMLARGEG